MKASQETEEQSEKWSILQPVASQMRATVNWWRSCSNANMIFYSVWVLIKVILHFDVFATGILVKGTALPHTQESRQVWTSRNKCGIPLCLKDLQQSAAEATKDLSAVLERTNESYFNL